MAFNYAVTFSDPYAGFYVTQDAIVRQSLYGALATWSQYLNGVGTLEVQLNLAPLGAPDAGSEFTLAEGGPTTTVAEGTTPDGHALQQSAAINELLTGAHEAGSDITITFNSQLLQLVTAMPSPGSNPISLTTLFEHELMHGFGVVGDRTEPGLLPSYESTFDAQSQVSFGGPAYFTGANAEALYGGPVPLTTGAGSGSDYYHVGATGTSADPASLRSDAIYPVALPGQALSGLDVALLEDIGAPLSAAGSALANPPPTGTITVLAAAQPYAAVTDPTVGGTAQPGRTVTVQTASGAVVGTAVVSASGAWSVRPAGLQDGVQTLAALVGGTQIGSTPLNLDDIAVATTLYQQILGRPIDAASLSGTVHQLYNGESVAAFAAGLANSNEAAADLATIYLSTVGRAVTAPELTANEAALVAGASQAGIRLALADSTEEATALQTVYTRVVGRSITGSEVAADVATLASGAATLPGLRAYLATTAEATGKVQSLFQDVVGRSATGAEVAANEAAFGSGVATLAGLRAYFATTVEATGKLQSLYQDVVGRAATGGEVVGTEAATGSGAATLAGLRAYFATTMEATSKLQGLYQAELGRAITPPEIAGDEQSIGSGSASLAGLQTYLATTQEASMAIQGVYQVVLGRAGHGGGARRSGADPRHDRVAADRPGEPCTGCGRGHGCQCRVPVGARPSGERGRDRGRPVRAEQRRQSADHTDPVGPVVGRRAAATAGGRHDLAGDAWRAVPELRLRLGEQRCIGRGPAGAGRIFVWRRWRSPDHRLQPHQRHPADPERPGIQPCGVDHRLRRDCGDQYRGERAGSGQPRRSPGGRVVGGELPVRLTAIVQHPPLGRDRVGSDGWRLVRRGGMHRRGSALG